MIKLTWLGHNVSLENFILVAVICWLSKCKDVLFSRDMSWIRYYSITSFTTWVTEQKVHTDYKRLRKKRLPWGQNCNTN